MSKLTMQLLGKVLELLQELNESREMIHLLRLKVHNLQLDLKHQIRERDDDTARLKLQSRS
jgi:hypothetical protein